MPGLFESVAGRPGQRASIASSGTGSGVSTKYTNAFGPAETTRTPSRSHDSRTSR